MLCLVRIVRVWFLIRSEQQPTSIITLWFRHQLATTAHKYLIENSQNALANRFWYRSGQQGGSKLSDNCLSDVSFNFFHSGCSYPYEINQHTHTHTFFYLNRSILCCLTSSRAHPTPHQWVKPRKHVWKSWSIKKKKKSHMNFVFREKVIVTLVSSNTNSSNQREGSCKMGFANSSTIKLDVYGGAGSGFDRWR